MRSLAIFGFLAASSWLTASALAAPAAKGVQVVANKAQRRVDITIDGQPFTSYIWPSTLKKPVLYPLIDADGVTLSRSFPPGPGERVDHPHHVGLWFNYARVNNFDFWNNSEAIKPENRKKMGTIVFDKLLSTKSGPNRGELSALSTWIDGNDHPILEETTHFVFSTSHGARVIDRIATLKSLDHVVFEDEKDGMLGIRVASWLELPTAGGGVYVDSHGVETKVATASPDATGDYLTSEGVKGDAAWSTRGRWCSLTGHKNDHTVTIAIFDEPKNPGYPTTWHARGYGLFAANPLGISVFNKKEPPMNFTLEKGQSATFRYRIVFYTHAATPKELNKEADAFAATYK
ncbi:MAG TPA: PmoA family protein [Terracidiphilus sp.]|nr:PmoA family protein [Terracidiphilus sp.]